MTKGFFFNLNKWFSLIEGHVNSYYSYKTSRSYTGVDTGVIKGRGASTHVQKSDVIRLKEKPDQV